MRGSQRLGDWVRDAEVVDAVTQRWFATACHRHAWHADLWDARRPTIPGPSTAHPTIGLGPAPVYTGERVAAYRAYLDGQITALAALRRRVDPDVDPSTTRVIDLVRTDLTDLRARLSSV